MPEMLAEDSANPMLDVVLNGVRVQMDVGLRGGDWCWDVCLSELASMRTLGRLAGHAPTAAAARESARTARALLWEEHCERSYTWPFVCRVDGRPFWET